MHSKLQSRRSIPRSSRPFSVVIAYDNCQSCRDAENILSLIWQQAGEGSPIQKSSWPLDLFQNPEIKSLAAQDAAEADMIFIAATENGTLTDDLAGWVQSWISHRHHKPGALVTLLERPSSRPPTSPLESYLKSVARKGNLDFFCRSRVNDLGQ